MINRIAMKRIRDSRQPKYRAQIQGIDGSWSFIGSKHKTPLDAKQSAQHITWTGVKSRVIDTTNGAILNL